MRSKIVDKLLKSTPKDIEVYVDLYADLVVRINQILKKKGISKKELAIRLDKKPSEISKWLGGEHNFTLRSLAKLSAELDEPLLEVPNKKTFTSYVEDGYVCTVHTFISKTKITQKVENIKWQKSIKCKSEPKLSYVG